MRNIREDFYQIITFLYKVWTEASLIIYEKKTCLQETLNHLPCLDKSSTNTKKLKEKKSHVLRVMCQVSHHNSCVTSNMSHVMCHMSPVTPDTTTTTNPPPAKGSHKKKAD